VRFLAPIALAAAVIGTPATAKDEVTRLFADDTPIDVTISGPVKTIVRKAARSTDPYPATVEANGESYAIELAARGNSRRQPETCQFPPLSVRFVDKPAEQGLFDGQKKLKLVTHCRGGSRFEQNTLREYAAYRLFNVLTDKSFKVRLARVRYVDDGKEVDRKWGFFIEDIDDVGDRVDAKEIGVESVPKTAFIPEDEARFVLFQYMIGNLDWAETDGPGASDCCHNSKLLGATKEARTNLTPVPYDFDYSGIVDAPYAVPPLGIPVRSVTQRYYRGFCINNNEALRLAPEFTARRAALEAAIRSVPGLDQRNQDDMIDYLEGFFEDIATPEEMRDELLKVCR